MSDELSTGEQDALVTKLLGQMLGPAATAVGPVLDAAALGLVNSTWRNSPVEDWHADGRLTDGEMLRVNSHSTWRVREIVRRWRRSIGVSAREPAETLDLLTADDVVVLARRLLTWFTNPERRLATGMTLRDLASADLDEWSTHAESSLYDIVTMAENAGAGFALRRVAVHGAMVCRGWWGSPTWPDQVRSFVDVLSSPENDHWSTDRYGKIMMVRPTAAADPAALERSLTARPWELPPAVADWVVRAGIGFLVAPMPPLSD